MPKAQLNFVLACYNRRETTLRCLSSLYAQKRETYNLAVTLLDDASSDGTASAVRAQFPLVQVIAGDGTRFWGGGMFDAMQEAKKRPFDYIVWLNDDVLLDDGAIERLLECSAAVDAAEGKTGNVICGAMRDGCSERLSYGGFKRTSRWNPSKIGHISPSADGSQLCDTINGNLVLVPAAVIERVGNLDPVFVHALGDIDFGFRVRRSGGRLWLAPGFFGRCDLNTGTAPWTDRRFSLSGRLRSLWSPRGLPVRPWTTFMWRWGGVIGLVLGAGMYAKAIYLATRPAWFWRASFK